MEDIGCVFCEKIESEDLVISEDGKVVRFTPLNPVVQGHMLFVPLEHISYATSNPKLTGLVMEAACTYAKEFCNDCNIIVNVGMNASQTVFHLHIHVVPRIEEDGLKLPWTDQHKNEN